MTLYYLNISAKGNNDGSSPENAWETLQTAMTAINGLPDKGAGDTLIVYEGEGSDFRANYGSWTLGNELSDWLTIQAAEHESPVFDSLFINKFNVASEVKYLKLKFDGITFEDTDYNEGSNLNHIRFTLAGDIEFSNCILKPSPGGFDFSGDTGTPYAYHGFHFGGKTDNLIIKNCLITRYDESDNRGFQTGIYFENGTYPAYDNVSIENNTIEYCQYGIVLISNINTIIKNCEVRNIFTDGIVMTEGTDITIEDSQIHDIFPITYDITITNCTYIHTGDPSGEKIILADIPGSLPSTDRTSGYVRLYQSGILYRRPSDQLSYFTISSNDSDKIILDSTTNPGEDVNGITEIRWYSGLHPDGIQANDSSQATNNITIQRCILYNLEGQGMIFDGHDTTSQATGLLIQNNLIYNANLWGGITSQIIVGAHDAIVANNTVDGRIVFLGDPETSSTPTYKAYNNVCYVLSRSTTYPNIFEENNNIFTLGVIFTHSPNDINVTTEEFFNLFKKVTDIRGDWDNYESLNGSPNYKAASAKSLLVNNGNYLYSPSTDILGNLRDVGAPDIGAYEYILNPSEENPSNIDFSSSASSQSSSSSSLSSSSSDSSFSSSLSSSSSSISSSSVSSSSISSSSSSVSSSTSSSSSSSFSSSSLSSSSNSSSSSSSSSTITKLYSRGELSSLPSTDDDLTSSFSTSDYATVSAVDDNRIAQTATAKYAVFLFKNKNIEKNVINISSILRSSKAPYLSPIHLEIYNRTTSVWKEIDNNNTSNKNIDFTLSKEITTNLSDYFDENYWISYRIWQLSN